MMSFQSNSNADLSSSDIKKETSPYIGNGINHLIRLYSLEFGAYLKTIKVIVIVAAIIIFIFTVLLYILVLINLSHGLSF